MAVPTPGPIVIDAGILVEVDRQKNRSLQRLLREAAQEGLVLIPSPVFNEMGRYRGKRKWARRFLSRFEERVKVRLYIQDELIRFASKLRAHPGLSVADVACLVVARARDIPLATVERLLAEAARAQGIPILDVPETTRYLRSALRRQPRLL